MRWRKRQIGEEKEPGVRNILMRARKEQHSFFWEEDNL
jgi:hypothetical protein